MRPGDRLSVMELFFALLLPSGNDAALVLANYFGSRLLPAGAKQSLAVRAFIKEMNCQAQKLGMLNTIFDSPHGLANSFNVSTAFDIAVLTSACMQIETIAHVVRTPFLEL